MSYRAYDNPDLGFTTRQLHAGYDPAENHLAKNVPVYQTAAFEFGDFERCVRVSSGKEAGAVSYSRCANPTNQVLERRMASLDGGTAALSFSSGMAAITATLLNLCEAGDEIIAAPTMYGESVSLISEVLPSYGIRGHIVTNPDDIGEFASLINDRTRAIYIESLGNPLINIVDFDALAEVAHAQGVPLVVDNTFATPYLFCPFKHGADIAVYSATKYLGGHGTTVAGIVSEKGDFDWFNGRFPQIEAFYRDAKKRSAPEVLENKVFTRRLYSRLLAHFGAHLAAQSAFLIIQGLETLSLRMREHAKNAQAVAEYLDASSYVSQVDYPGLPSNRYHELAERYFPRGLTGMLSLRVKGGRAAAVRFLDSLELFDQMVNVGDAKSYAVYPSIATHFTLTEEEREKAGIFPDTVRLSIGIEDIDDLIADLDQAFRKAGSFA